MIYGEENCHYTYLLTNNTLLIGSVSSRMMYIPFLIMVYLLALTLFSRDEYKLDSCGLSYMWNDQHEIHTKQCTQIIHQRKEVIALQKWNINISTSSMCRMYRLFKK